MKQRQSKSHKVNLEENACNMGNNAFSKKNFVVLLGLGLEILVEK
jgi:hypothetical protein